MLRLDGAKARIGGHSVALVCHDAPLPAAEIPDGIPFMLNSNESRTIKVMAALTQSPSAYMTSAYTARQLAEIEARSGQQGAQKPSRDTHYLNVRPKKGRNPFR